MIQSRKGLEKINPYDLPAYSRKDKIRMDLNENNFGCSPKVLKAIKTCNPLEMSIYPECDKLINKIADEFQVKSENVLLTDGGDDAIRCVIDTFVDRKDEVLIPAPNYSMFKLYTNLSGGKIKEVLYNEDFSFPTLDLLKSISSKTKLIVIVNPASPTGTVIKKNDLIKILEKAKHSVILLDETYFHFSGNSYAKLIKKYSNLIIIQTFSKVFGLAGMRLGFIVTNKNLIEKQLKVAFPYPISALSAIAGLAAISDKSYTNKIIEKINIEKKFLCKSLNGTANEVRNTHTNFILAKFTKYHRELHNELFERGILIKNISALPLMEGYFRISVGTHEENKILISIIKKILTDF